MGTTRNKMLSLIENRCVITAMRTINERESFMQEI